MKNQFGIYFILCLTCSLFLACVPPNIHAYSGPLLEPAQLAVVQTNPDINHFGICEIDGKWPPLFQSGGLLGGGIIKGPIHFTAGQHTIRVSLTLDYMISTHTLYCNVAFVAEPGTEYVIQVSSKFDSSKMGRHTFLWVEEKLTRRVVVPPFPVIPSRTLHFNS
jgi:hypothetical protein